MLLLNLLQLSSSFGPKLSLKYLGDLTLDEFFILSERISFLGLYFDKAEFYFFSENYSFFSADFKLDVYLFDLYAI